MGACRLWGLVTFDCQMVVTDKRFLLVPVDRPHWIFRGRIGSKKVRPICGDLQYLVYQALALCLMDFCVLRHTLFTSVVYDSFF